MESGVGGKMSGPSNSSLLVELLSQVFDSFYISLLDHALGKT